MLKCVCCKGHVHIVLGEGDVLKRSPSNFGWPLFTQEHIIRTREMILAGKACETIPPDAEEFFKRVMGRAKKQHHDERGRFGKSYLPKGHRGDGINPIRGWFDFVEGKSESFEYWYDHPTLLWTFFVPLTACSLINYITRPPTVLFRAGHKQEKWEARFEIPQNLEIV